jgi:hypothetical protein
LLHLYLDDDYPKFDEFQLKLTLKGSARINPHCPKQASKGIYNVLSQHCIVFDQQISQINIPLLLSYLIFFLHNCFLSSNCLTEFGTFNLMRVK